MKIGVKSIQICLFFLLCSSLMAMPKPDLTTLPCPEEIEDNDLSLVSEALKLQVYQDSDDANLYYYLPPFHVRQYNEGAATVAPYKYNIENFAEARMKVADYESRRQNYSQEELSKLEEKVRDNRKYVRDAHDKLEHAIETGKDELIALRKKSLADEENYLAESTAALEELQNKIAEGIYVLPFGMGRAYFDDALHNISAMGSNFSYSDSKDIQVLSREFDIELSRLANSYGGYMSFNIYGGFTKKQLEALILYRTKYLPGVKIVLLPTEELQFFPLTEWQKESGEESGRLSRMFRSIKGMGDYLGANITIDTTITGASGLANHLGTFIPPLGVKAIFKQKLHPAKAVLTCDFSNAFSIKGRTDIRDGLVIYDNDITQVLDAKDDSSGELCSIEYISGDPQSARFEALREIERTFDQYAIKRTQLSREEKNQYLHKMQKDISRNRVVPNRKSLWSKLVSYIWWGERLYEAVSSAASFYWHTDIRNVENISRVKFTKKISINGSVTVARPAAIDLCLFYNSEIGAYDRCTNKETDTAKPMMQSIAHAQQSSSCLNEFNPIRCGEKRDASGESLGRKVTSWAQDDITPDDI
ncbi:MAG: hypothetical protein KC505_06370 [Myxococcales bacterium]|nr:hypothetical protein [Myxococcales bacterium]USN51365.1 MAG: hypothetical protein H6731_02860 [Myxococcales bacterium]